MLRTWGPSALLVSLLLVGAMAGAQTPVPASLQKQLQKLYLVPPGSLSSDAPAENQPCGQPLLLTTQGATGTTTFQIESPPTTTGPINASYRPQGEWRVRFMVGAPADGTQPYVGSGFQVVVGLRIAGIDLGTRTHNVPASGSPPSDTFEVSFTTPSINETQRGPVQVSTMLRHNPVQDPAPPGSSSRSQAQLLCGPNTALTGASSASGGYVYLGAVGDGDFDGDGLPDGEDPDRDGDGIANTAEAALDCPALGERRFEDEPFEREGDHDGDGYSDEVECQRGFDPLDANQFPPRPVPFPWAWVIFLALLALLLILALLNFFVWGRVVDVVVLTTSELIVPRGGAARYDLEARMRRKKGRDVKFQLQARGLPEGWDAKMSRDHVTLGPVGTDRNAARFTLTVEAPEHEDPESAVVAVRAVPLAPSGRKDTFKTSAAAKTITSINVPPNAKVPVKRGDDPILLSEAEMAKRQATVPAPVPLPAAEPEAPAAPAGPWREKDRPVVDIEGVGETYAKKLAKLGIETVHALHAADTAQVAEKVGTPELTVRQWQAMAELIDVDGVGPQVAELLVRSGVYSIPQLANADAKELAQQVEAAGQNREVAIQGGPAGLKSVKAWIKAANKHPLSKEPARFAPPAPSLEAAPEPAAPAEPAPTEETPKRGLFGRRKKQPEPAPEPSQEPPTAPAEPAAEPAPDPAKKRFGFLGRKPKDAEPTPEAPAEAPAPEPPPAAAPPPAKPNLQVGGLQHAPPTFRPGEDVKSTVTVTNQGEGTHTIKLSLFVNDALADAQTVTVKSGKSKEVKFKWTAQDRNKLNIRGELVNP